LHLRRPAHPPVFPAHVAMIAVAVAAVAAAEVVANAAAVMIAHDVVARESEAPSIRKQWRRACLAR